MHRTRNAVAAITASDSLSRPVLICLQNLICSSVECRLVSSSATELGSKMVARCSGFVRPQVVWNPTKEMLVKDTLKSEFTRLLDRHALIVNQHNEARANIKTAREEFEEAFRQALDKTILPAAAEVKQLVEAKGWVCTTAKSSNGLSAKIEIYDGSMRAAGGSGRPHLNIMAEPRVNSVGVYLATPTFSGMKHSGLGIDHFTTTVVQQYLLELFQALVNDKSDLG